MSKTLTAAQKANRQRLLKARDRQVQNREMGPAMAFEFAIAESGERLNARTEGQGRGED